MLNSPLRYVDKLPTYLSIYLWSLAPAVAANFGFKAQAVVFFSQKSLKLFPSATRYIGKLLGYLLDHWLNMVVIFNVKMNSDKEETNKFIKETKTIIVYLRFSSPGREIAPNTGVNVTKFFTLTTKS